MQNSSKIKSNSPFNFFSFSKCATPKHKNETVNFKLQKKKKRAKMKQPNIENEINKTISAMNRLHNSKNMCLNKWAMIACLTKLICVGSGHIASTITIRTHTNTNTHSFTYTCNNN